QHDVRQIDGLSPRGGADLEPGDVDELEMTFTYQEVRRLDVAMRHPDVPEGPHESETLVDHRVVDPSLSQVGRVREELRDEHVFAVRRELDRAEGPRHPDPV